MCIEESGKLLGLFLKSGSVSDVTILLGKLFHVLIILTEKKNSS